jgi:hypothetical protein
LLDNLVKRFQRLLSRFPEVNEQNIYDWRQRYGAFGVNELRRCKKL